MASFDAIPFTIQKPTGEIMYTSLLVTIEGMSLQEGAMLNQQEPYDAYNAYVEDIFPLPNIRRGYILIDERSDDGINPDTGKAQRYTVMGTPITYTEDMHLEFKVIVPVGW